MKRETISKIMFDFVKIQSLDKIMIKRYKYDIKTKYNTVYFIIVSTEKE